MYPFLNLPSTRTDFTWFHLITLSSRHFNPNNKWKTLPGKICKRRKIFDERVFCLPFGTEASEDGFPEERRRGEPGERWRYEGKGQLVVHARGHVLRRVRRDRPHGDIPDRREAWHGRRWERGPRRSQERASTAGCARSAGLRGDRSKYAITTICIRAWLNATAAPYESRDLPRLTCRSNYVQRELGWLRCKRGDRVSLPTIGIIGSLVCNV